MSGSQTGVGGHLPSCPSCSGVSRRSFLTMVAAGLGLVAAGCSSAGAESTRNDTERPRSTPTGRQPRPGGAALPVTSTTTPPVVQLDAIPPARAGAPTTYFGGPRGTSQVAITIDDGLCAPCADFYVNLAQETGIHLTFNPNGNCAAIWEPLAPMLRPLIETGQVQIGNHTFNHYNLLGLSDGMIQQQILRNEEWIELTFGITARPWFRPPYGYHNQRTDTVAGELGYTNILMWNGSFGDSTPISPQQLLSLANQYLTPGTIVIGHANYPTITSLWGQIQELIAERGLVPVTLDEMFGTSRRTG